MKSRIHRNRSGQIVVALAIMLLALAILALMNIDTFLALRGKTRAVNAGDAAAMAAAHWQGITLNLVGELNLARLDAICLCAEEPDKAYEISSGILALQERIAFAGPTMGLLAASQAAAMNYSGVSSNMTEIVDESIKLAQRIEPEGSASWPSRWKDYAQMLHEARGQGLHATCNNAHLFDLFTNFADGHILHSKPFYEAIIGRDWCWFFLRKSMYSLLRNFQSWPALGDPLDADCDNPEYFGVAFRRGMLDIATLRDIFPDFAAKYNLPSIIDEKVETVKLSNVNDLPWFQYDLGTWRRWNEMDTEGYDRLPLLSSPKDEYNILGATAAASAGGGFPIFTPAFDEKVQNLKGLNANAFSTEEEREEKLAAEKWDWMSAMAEGGHGVGWSAAAKPFGCRETSAGREPVTHFNGQLFPLVTPDFTTVRLIPLAGASGGNLSTGDAGWVVHIREHLPPYMENGHKTPGCKWCSALARWDDPEFRHSGVEWLKHNSDQCLVTGGGGSYTPQGGTRHAH